MEAAIRHKGLQVIAANCEGGTILEVLNFTRNQMQEARGFASGKGKLAPGCDFKLANAELVAFRKGLLARLLGERSWLKILEVNRLQGFLDM